MIKFLSTSLLLISLLFAVDKQGQIKEEFNVSGIVIGKNGSGLKKVKLIIYDENGQEIDDEKTNGSGEFKFKKIRIGNYTIKGTHKKEGQIDTEFSVKNKDVELTIDYTQKRDSDLREVSSVTTEEISAPKQLPQQRTKPENNKLKFDELFFEYESNLKALKTEIDSLKRVVKGYEKGQTMPNISREILDLIKVPEQQHRVELQNGTVVSGELLQESDSTLTLKTQIGTLVLKKEMVVRMDEMEKPGPKVVFIGDPFIDYYPDKQIFSGEVKNIGQIRADFVRVIGNLFTQTTDNAGTDSIFVKGSRTIYDSNVVTDTALEPGQSASYILTVTINKGKKPQYHTMDIHWSETN
ncbi:MAG: SpaA isopeptide-forming pilin-related protein [Candidatus Neomarinimicrobiota bacterium]